MFNGVFCFLVVSFYIIITVCLILRELLFDNILVKLYVMKFCLVFLVKFSWKVILNFKYFIFKVFKRLKFVIFFDMFKRIEKVILL